MAVTIERLVPWFLRAAWIVVGVTVASMLDDLDDLRSTSLTAVRIALAVAWVAGAVATTFPAVRTLTAVRSLVPLGVPVCIAGWAGGVAIDASALALGSSVLATTISLSADLGRAFVQASAYGAEDRHVLRAPPAYLAAAVVTWVAAATGLTVGGALLVSGHVVTGPIVAGLGALVGIWSIPRWHRLSRRWLVVVPAGLVLHDHLVLAETLMIDRARLAGVTLARADTSAADLTGPAGGHALEISTHESVTAVLAGTPRRPGGRAIHLTAALVAPTRPGRALAATGRRRGAPPVS